MQKRNKRSRSTRSDFTSIILDLIDALVVVMDARGRIVFFNRSCESVTGFSSGEVEGRLIWDVLIPVTEVEDVKAVFADLASGSFPNRHVNDWLTKTGDTRLIEWANTSLVDDNGVIEYVVGTGIDITELSQAESERRLTRFAIDHAGEGVFITDAGGRFVFVNEVACEELGYTRDELLTMWVGNISPEFNEKMWEERWKEISEKGSITFESILERKNGSCFPVELSANYFTHEGREYSTGLARDISERKRAERALWESEEKYRVLVESLDEGILAADLEGVITFANRRMADMLGSSVEEMTGRSVFDYMEEVSGLEGRFGLPGGLEGTDEESEFKFRRADGSMVFVSIHPAPLYDSHGNLVGSLAGIVDITDRKEARERREFILRLLEFVNRSREAADVVPEMIDMIKGFTGIEAIGLRLREGDDYPYRYTRGFPEEFLESETVIRTMDESGALRCGPEDQPLMDCFCGDVLQGRTETLPCFTRAGSFWSNDLAAFCETAAVKDLARGRLACNKQGFRSSAIVPLRLEDETIGLLQLSDHRGGFFSDDAIVLLEEAAEILGVALSRVAAQEALRNSEERFRTASMAANDLVWEWDILTNHLEWFGDIDSALGYEPGEFPRNIEAWESSVHPDDHDRVMVTLREATRPDGRYYEEYRIRRKNGEYAEWMARGHVLSGRDGTPIKMVGVSADVTESRRAEEALRESEARYKAHFLNSSDVIYAMGSGPSLISISPSVEGLLGYRPDEIVGANFTKLNVIARECVGQVVQDTLAILAGEEVGPAEYVFIAKDGSRKVGEVRASPLIKDGEIVGTVGVARDITERKHLEEERKRLNQELERRVIERTGQLQTANKELEAFTYSVSHDLRTPLRAIDGFTGMLEQEYAGVLDDDGRRLLGVIRKNSSYMGELIDHLLTLSRVERRELAKLRVDMNGLVRQVLNELAPSMEGREVELVLGDLPVIEGDPVMWQQVWANLISNAAKFTGKKEDARIEVGCITDGSEHVFFVRDNGAGFDMRYVDKLFGVFRRLHSHGDYEGVGIGLALVQRIVRKHGGRVWAEGKVDEGATFYFTANVVESEFPETQ